MFRQEKQDNMERRREKMDMSDNNADKPALELMKQIITLSSGVLAISATFIINVKSISPKYLILIAVSWIVLLISLFFGLETISTIVQGRLEKNDRIWSEGYGRVCGIISKYAFFIGLALFVLSAFLSILSIQKNKIESRKESTNNVIQYHR